MYVSEDLSMINGTFTYLQLEVTQLKLTHIIVKFCADKRIIITH